MLGPGSLYVLLHSCLPPKKPLIYCNFGFTWVLSPPSSSCDEGTKAPRLVIQARPTMLIEVNGEGPANTDPDFAELFTTQGSCNASVLYTHSPFQLQHLFTVCLGVSTRAIQSMHVIPKAEFKSQTREVYSVSF